MSRFSFAIPRIALPERFNAILYNTFALPGLLLCAIAVVCSPLPSRSHASPLPCFPPRSYATACLICSFASLIFSQLSHDVSSPCRAFPSHFMGLRSQDCAIPLFSLLLPRQSRISMLCPCPSALCVSFPQRVFSYLHYAVAYSSIPLRGGAEISHAFALLNTSCLYYALPPLGDSSLYKSLASPSITIPQPC